jgi:hypothetical protein
MATLRDVCLDCNLEKLKRFVDSGTSIQSAFRWACVGGHLDGAKWLLSIEPRICIRKNNYEAFRLACFNGHLHITKWLLSVEPSINVRAYDNMTLCWVCVYGHLHIAKWLLSMAAPFDAFVRNKTFRFTCNHAVHRLAKWLQRMFPDVEHEAMKAFKSRRAVQLASFF